MKEVEAKDIVWESITELWVVRTKEISWLFSRQIESRREGKVSKMLGTSHILNLHVKSCWLMHPSPSPLLSFWSRPPSSPTLMAVIPPDWVLYQSSLYIVSRVSLPKGKSDMSAHCWNPSVAPHISRLKSTHLTWLTKLLTQPVNIKMVMTNIYWTPLNISTYSEYFTFAISLTLHT